MKSCEPLAFAGPSRAPHLGGFARTASAPVRLCFLTVRVSRGVSALGPVKSLGLGPAPSSRLAANPGNEIRDTSELFLLPYTPSTSTRTRLFPVHRPRLFVGRVLERDAAHPNRRPARFTTRDDRFGGPSFALWGLVGPTHARDDLPLTLLSRSSLRYRCVPFAVHVGPIRRGSPRPLPPRRRDATKLFPVQSAFVRQGMRCSSSALSSGDRASCAPWICSARAPPRVPSHRF